MSTYGICSCAYTHVSTYVFTYGNYIFPVFINVHIFLNVFRIAFFGFIYLLCKNIYTHTYIYVYIINKDVCIYLYDYINTHIYIYTHLHIYMYIHICIYIYVLIDLHTYAHTHTRTHAHTHTKRHIQTHKNTYTYT